MAEQQEPGIDQPGREALDNEPQAAGPASSEPEQKTARPPGRGLALLALVVALAGLGLGGWQWWSAADVESVAENEIAELERVQGEQVRALREIRQELDTLAGQLGRQAAVDVEGPAGAIVDRKVNPLQSRLTRIEQQSGEDRARLDALEFIAESSRERLAASERALADLSTMGQGSERQLAWAEVEYLLRLGNERLRLFGDKQSALDTLRLADRQLAALDDPVLTGVRQRLQADIQALEAVPAVDLVRVSSDLQSLEQAVPGWRFRNPAAQASEAGSDRPGLLARLASTLKSLVTVRKQAAGDPAFLTIEERDWLRERIAINLQIARISALRRDQDTFREIVRTVSEWHATHFDPRADGYASVRQTFERLEDMDLQPELPDITGALQQLQYLRNSAPARATAPARADPGAGDDA